METEYRNNWQQPNYLPCCRSKINYTCFPCGPATPYFILVHARLLQPNLHRQAWSPHGRELPDAAVVPHCVHVSPGWLLWVTHGGTSGQQLWPVRDSSVAQIRLALLVAPARRAQQHRTASILKQSAQCWTWECGISHV